MEKSEKNEQENVSSKDEISSQKKVAPKVAHPYSPLSLICPGHLKEALSFDSSKNLHIGPDLGSYYSKVLCNISKPTLHILYFNSVLEPLDP